MDARGRNGRDPRAIRNATVVAEQDLDLLVIPKGVFLEHWHSTYDQKSFAALFRGWTSTSPAMF
jgi:hypothetical protein